MNIYILFYICIGLKCICVSSKTTVKDILTKKSFQFCEHFLYFNITDFSFSQILYYFKCKQKWQRFKNFVIFTFAYIYSVPTVITVGSRYHKVSMNYARNFFTVTPGVRVSVLIWKTVPDMSKKSITKLFSIIYYKEKINILGTKMIQMKSKKIYICLITLNKTALPEMKLIYLLSSKCFLPKWYITRHKTCFHSCCPFCHIRKWHEY